MLPEKYIFIDIYIFMLKYIFIKIYLYFSKICVVSAKPSVIPKIPSPRRHQGCCPGSPDGSGRRSGGNSVPVKLIEAIISGENRKERENREKVRKTTSGGYCVIRHVRTGLGTKASGRSLKNRWRPYCGVIIKQRKEAWPQRDKEAVPNKGTRRRSKTKPGV